MKRFVTVGNTISVIPSKMRKTRKFGDIKAKITWFMRWATGSWRDDKSLKDLRGKAFLGRSEKKIHTG